ATKKTSETYYDVHLGKGDEIADRSFNYAGDGATLKSKTIYEYGSAAVTAGAAGNSAANTQNSEDCMVRSVSYRTSSYADSGTKTSETYYNIRLGKGDEIADYSITYKTGTSTIRATTVNFYTTGDGTTGAVKRAGDSNVNSDSRLAITVSYKGNQSGSVSSITDPNADSFSRQTVTYYKGERGLELADYSLQYKTGEDVLRAISVNYYGSEHARAESAALTTEDKITRTDSINYNQYAVESEESPTLPAGIEQPDGIIGIAVGSSRTENRYEDGLLVSSVTNSNAFDRHSGVGINTSVTNTTYNNFEEAESSVTDSLSYDRHTAAGTADVAIADGLIAAPAGSFGVLTGSSRTVNTYDGNANLASSETTGNSFDKWTRVGTSTYRTVTTYDDFGDAAESQTDSISYDRHTTAGTTEMVVPEGLVSAPSGSFGVITGVSHSVNTYTDGCITNTNISAQSFDKWTGVGVGVTYSAISYDSKEEISVYLSYTTGYDRRTAAGTINVNPITGIGGAALITAPAGKFGILTGSSVTLSYYTGGAITESVTKSDSFDKWTGNGIGISYTVTTFDDNEEVESVKTSSISFDRSVGSTDFTLSTGLIEPVTGVFGAVTGIAYSESYYTRGAIVSTTTWSESRSKTDGHKVADSVSYVKFDANEDVAETRAYTVSYNTKLVTTNGRGGIYGSVGGYAQVKFDCNPVSDVSKVWTEGAPALVNYGDGYNDPDDPNDNTDVPAPTGVSGTSYTVTRYTNGEAVQSVTDGASYYKSGERSGTSHQVTDYITAEGDKDGSVGDPKVTNSTGMSYRKDQKIAGKTTSSVTYYSNGLPTHTHSEGENYDIENPRNNSKFESDLSYVTKNDINGGYDSGSLGDPMKGYSVTKRISDTTSQSGGVIESEWTVSETITEYVNGEVSVTTTYGAAEGNSMSVSTTYYVSGEAYYTHNYSVAASGDESSSTTIYSDDIAAITISSGGNFSDLSWNMTVNRYDDLGRIGGDDSNASWLASLKSLLSANLYDSANYNILSTIIDCLEHYTELLSVSKLNPGVKVLCSITYGKSTDPTSGEVTSYIEYSWAADGAIAGSWTYATTRSAMGLLSGVSETRTYYDSIGQKSSMHTIGYRTDDKGNRNDYSTSSYPGLSTTQYYKYDKDEGTIGPYGSIYQKYVGCGIVATEDWMYKYTIASPPDAAGSTTTDWEKALSFDNSGNLIVYWYIKPQAVESNASLSGLCQTWKYRYDSAKDVYVLYEIYDSQYGTITISNSASGVTLSGTNINVTNPSGDYGEPYSVTVTEKLDMSVDLAESNMLANLCTIFTGLNKVLEDYSIVKATRGYYATQELADVTFDQAIGLGQARLTIAEITAWANYYDTVMSSYLGRVSSNLSAFIDSDGSGDGYSEEVAGEMMWGSSLELIGNNIEEFSGSFSSSLQYMSESIDRLIEDAETAKKNAADLISGYSTDGEGSGYLNNKNTLTTAAQGVIDACITIGMTAAQIRAIKTADGYSMYDFIEDGKFYKDVEGSASCQGIIADAWDDFITSARGIKTKVEALQSKFATIDNDLEIARTEFRDSVDAETRKVEAALQRYNEECSATLAWSCISDLLRWHKQADSPYGSGQDAAGNLYNVALAAYNAITAAAKAYATRVESAATSLRDISLMSAVGEITGAYYKALTGYYSKKTELANSTSKMVADGIMTPDLAYATYAMLADTVSAIYDARHEEYLNQKKIEESNYQAARAAGVTQTDGKTPLAIYEGNIKKLDEEWKEIADAYSSISADYIWVPDFGYDTGLGADFITSSEGLGRYLELMGKFIQDSISCMDGIEGNLSSIASSTRSYLGGEGRDIGEGVVNRSLNIALMEYSAVKAQAEYEASEKLYDAYAKFDDDMYNAIVSALASDTFTQKTEYYNYAPGADPSYYYTVSKTNYTGSNFKRTDWSTFTCDMKTQSSYTNSHDSNSNSSSESIASLTIYFSLVSISYDVARYSNDWYVPVNSYYYTWGVYYSTRSPDNDSPTEETTDYWYDYWDNDKVVGKTVTTKTYGSLNGTQLYKAALENLPDICSATKEYSDAMGCSYYEYERMITEGNPGLYFVALNSLEGPSDGGTIKVAYEESAKTAQSNNLNTINMVRGGNRYDYDGNLVSYGMGARLAAEKACLEARFTYYGDNVTIDESTHDYELKLITDYPNGGNNSDTWEYEAPPDGSEGDGTLKESITDGDINAGVEDKAWQTRLKSLRSAKMGYAHLAVDYIATLKNIDKESTDLVTQAMNETILGSVDKQTGYNYAVSLLIAAYESTVSEAIIAFRTSWQALCLQLQTANTSLRNAVDSANETLIETVNAYTGFFYTNVTDLVRSWRAYLQQVNPDNDYSETSDSDIISLVKDAMPELVKTAIKWYESRIAQALDAWYAVVLGSSDSNGNATKGLIGCGGNYGTGYNGYVQDAIERFNLTLNNAYTWLNTELTELQEYTTGLAKSLLNAWHTVHSLITGEYMTAENLQDYLDSLEFDYTSYNYTSKVLSNVDFMAAMPTISSIGDPVIDGGQLYEKLTAFGLPSMSAYYQPVTATLENVYRTGYSIDRPKWEPVSEGDDRFAYLTESVLDKVPSNGDLSGLSNNDLEALVSDIIAPSYRKLIHLTYGHHRINDYSTDASVYGAYASLAESYTANQLNALVTQYNSDVTTMAKIWKLAQNYGRDVDDSITFTNLVDTRLKSTTSAMTRLQWLAGSYINTPVLLAMRDMYMTTVDSAGRTRIIANPYAAAYWGDDGTVTMRSAEGPEEKEVSRPAPSPANRNFKGPAAGGGNNAGQPAGAKPAPAARRNNSAIAKHAEERRIAGQKAAPAGNGAVKDAPQVLLDGFRGANPKMYKMLLNLLGKEKLVDLLLGKAVNVQFARLMAVGKKIDPALAADLKVISAFLNKVSKALRIDADEVCGGAISLKINSQGKLEAHARLSEKALHDIFRLCKENSLSEFKNALRGFMSPAAEKLFTNTIHWFKDDLGAAGTLFFDISVHGGQVVMDVCAGLEWLSEICPDMFGSPVKAVLEKLAGMGLDVNPQSNPLVRITLAPDGTLKFSVNSGTVVLKNGRQVSIVIEHFINRAGKTTTNVVANVPTARGLVVSVNIFSQTGIAAEHGFMVTGNSGVIKGLMERLAAVSETDITPANAGSMLKTIIEKGFASISVKIGEFVFTAAGRAARDGTYRFTGITTTVFDRNGQSVIIGVSPDSNYAQVNFAARVIGSSSILTVRDLARTLQRSGVASIEAALPAPGGAGQVTYTVNRASDGSVTFGARVTTANNTQVVLSGAGKISTLEKAVGYALKADLKGSIEKAAKGLLASPAFKSVNVSVTMTDERGNQSNVTLTRNKELGAVIVTRNGTASVALIESKNGTLITVGISSGTTYAQIKAAVRMITSSAISNIDALAAVLQRSGVASIEAALPAPGGAGQVTYTVNRASDGSVTFGARVTTANNTQVVLSGALGIIGISSGLTASAIEERVATIQSSWIFTAQDMVDLSQEVSDSTLSADFDDITYTVDNSSSGRTSLSASLKSNGIGISFYGAGSLDLLENAIKSALKIDFSQLVDIGTAGAISTELAKNPDIRGVGVKAAIDTKDGNQFVVGVRQDGTPTLIARVDLGNGKYAYTDNLITDTGEINQGLFKIAGMVGVAIRAGNLQPAGAAEVFSRLMMAFANGNVTPEQLERMDLTQMMGLANGLMREIAKTEDKRPQPNDLMTLVLKRGKTADAPLKAEAAGGQLPTVKEAAPKDAGFQAFNVPPERPGKDGKFPPIAEAPKAEADGMASTNAMALAESIARQPNQENIAKANNPEAIAAFAELARGGNAFAASALARIAESNNANPQMRTAALTALVRLAV
ncbi:MAG: hypothetical protein WC522_09495, partial [Candidatus Omnitrophota bacterium]